MDRTSAREIVHLVASLIVLTIAFAYPSLDPGYLAKVALSVGIGFILHELAHKFTAQRYGYVAEYEASPIGLLLALGLKYFTGVVFAAPGAVMIRGRRIAYSQFEDRYWDSIQSAKEFAYISVSGAAVNLVLGIVFFVLSLFISNQLAFEILRGGAFINVFLAGFNMIPVGPLDGAKVLRYNPALWLAVAIPAVILFLFFTLL